MNRHNRSRRGAFTLVELMVVIVIIGILAGLLSVAVYNAVLAARKTKIKAEIDNLHLALERYATDRGEVPPCLGDYVTGAGGSPERRDRFIRHLRKAHGRFTVIPTTSTPLFYCDSNGNGGLKKYVKDNFNLDLDNIDQAEALVFWLGGPPAPPGTSSTKLLGWSANVSNPFQLNGSRKEVLFEFEESRLVDLDGDGWPEYQPAVASSTGATPPYVYFDAASYEKLEVQYYPCVTSVPPYTPSHKSLRAQWGVAVPYMSKFTSGGAPQITMINPKKFQIISAGLDSIYTSENYKGPSGNMLWTQYPLYPSGINYGPGEQDNLTNFSEGTLKDAIP